jgi:hypothetical protein
MPFNHTTKRVALVLFALLTAAPAFGQGLAGLQLFAPADVSTFGGDQEPNEGYFFQFDGLWWSISPPDTKFVGKEGLTRVVSYGPHPLSAQDPFNDTRVETNTITSGDLSSQFSAGNRFEFGRVEDRNGWFVSIYQMRDQTQELTFPSGDVVFVDPPTGPLGTQLLEGAIPLDPFLYPLDPTIIQRDLPVTLYNVSMIHSVDTWGVELMYLHRTMTMHHGGTFEFFGGARYLEFNDNFAIQAGADPGGNTVPSFLENSYWATTAQNHVVGPQFGLRWFKKQGRWTFSTEGRFTAGLNCQNIHQRVSLGPNLNPGGTSGNPVTNWSGVYTPATMAPIAAASDAYSRVFTPLIELRLEGRYQVTRNISLHGGWTGFWMDNIARANAVIDYTLPGMGIDLTNSNNKQDVFINGLTLGFDINR